MATQRRVLPASMWRMLALIFMIGGLLSLGAHAQMTVGHVTGTVTDPSGAVVAGAQVTLTNEGTSGQQHAVSTSTGSYTFEQVDAGMYSLRVEAPGFTTQVTHGIDVGIQQTITQNFKLAVGNVTTQVTVTEATPLLQAQDATVGQEVNQQMVDDLPLASRDWTSLAHIAAGVTTTNTGAQSGLTFSSNGVNSVQNDMRLNGIDDNMEFYGGFGTISTESSTSIVPPPDALQEFQLQESNYSAQFGHSTGSVMDAIIKSGTDTYKGDLWEYLRTTDFNANDWFNKKAEIGAGKPNIPVPYHENQFGGSIGGPMRLPFHQGGVKNTFWFFDAQMIRLVIPSNHTDSLPTCDNLASTGACTSTSMVGSGYQNMADMILDNSGTNTDSLGRVIPSGTIMDPATTRPITAGVPDSVTGITPTVTGTVRDPFFTGTIAGQTTFVGDCATAATCELNQLPSARIDPNAVTLINLFTNAGIRPNIAGFNNNTVFATNNTENVDQFDVRVDSSLNQNNIIWGVYDVMNALEHQPGALPGYAQGANYGGGNDWSPHWALAGSYTHIFNQSLTNVFRVGGQDATDINTPPYGNVTGVPASFGIQGLVGGPGVGGLPNISISKLPGMGLSGYNPVNHSTPNWEIDEVLTKIHGNHVFNMGYQLTDILAHLEQPTAGAGQASFNGQFSDLTNNDSGYTAMADMLLKDSMNWAPAMGYYEGGANNTVLSTTAHINSQRWYNAFFLQDDWKVKPKLTLNLGIRYDHYASTKSIDNRQSNLIGAGAGNGLFGTGGGNLGVSVIGGQYGHTNNGTLYVPSAACAGVPAAFVTELANDGIGETCTADRGAMVVQKLNFAPRVGFAYQFRPDLVVRGGFGITYGSLGNIGAAPYVIANNYPYVYSVQAQAGSSTVPIVYGSSYPNPGAYPDIEHVFTNLSVASPSSATIEGIQVAGMGIADKYETPYVESFNLTVQKQFGAHDSVQLAYVGDVGRHEDSRGGYNEPAIFLPVGTNIKSYSPYQDLGLGGAWVSTNGISAYNSLQAVYSHQVSAGLNLTANYTYSHCLTDASDISERVAYRAQYLAGFGQRGDYTNCQDDAAQAVHVAGTYALPLGQGKQFLSDANHVENELIGGWNINYNYIYQTGQPVTVNCHAATSAFQAVSTNNGSGSCVADITGNQYAGAHTVAHWLNSTAYSEPVSVTSVGQSLVASLGPHLLQSRGPVLDNFDTALMKNFAIKGDSTYLQFRAEQFNLFNHPEFGQPGTLSDPANGSFASITSVRNSVRLMQLSLKLYY